MPGFNGTGPQGFGPGTGRGLGPCGAGMARGFRGGGRNRGRRGFWCPFFAGRTWTRQQEKDMLEEEEQALKEQLQEIKRERQELEEETASEQD